MISTFNVELAPGLRILACDSWELRVAVELEVLFPSPRIYKNLKKLMSSPAEGHGQCWVTSRAILVLPALCHILPFPVPP